MGTHRDINFQGQCILYADFTWKNETSFVMKGSSAGNCDFPIYFSVFCMIFYGLTSGLYNSYAVLRSMKVPDIGSQMWVMPFILVNTLLAFTTLIVACVLSVGFNQFCNGLTEKHSSWSCSILENKPWKNLIKDKTFNAGPYYKLLSITEMAAWGCFVVFLLQVALSVLRFYRNRKQRSAEMFENIQKDTTNFAEVEPTA